MGLENENYEIKRSGQGFVSKRGHKGRRKRNIDWGTNERKGGAILRHGRIYAWLQFSTNRFLKLYILHVIKTFGNEIRLL